MCSGCSRVTSFIDKHAQHIRNGCTVERRKGAAARPRLGPLSPNRAHLVLVYSKG